MNRVWKIEIEEGTHTWSRIVRAPSLKIGSRLGNHLRLPHPCPAHLSEISKKESGRWSHEGSDKITYHNKKEALFFEWHKKKFLVEDVTDEALYQPISQKSINLGKVGETKDSGKTVWHFHQGRLLETDRFVQHDPKKNAKTQLGSGIHLELDGFTNKLITMHASGEVRVLALSTVDEGSLAKDGDHIYLLTATPDLSNLPGYVQEQKDKDKRRFAPIIFTVTATLLLVLALFQFDFISTDFLMEEALPEELTKLTIEKKIIEKVSDKSGEKKSGLPGGGIGGGGIEKNVADKRGGAGVASPDEVLVKNFNTAASGGNLLNALSSLDKKYTNQVAKAAVGAIGVGGPNTAQGVLKSLGNMMGSAGGGVGIGGIGTKGFGGGGGGGKGLGFGTQIGNGVGEGKELRQISFETGAGEVRGGLEKSEVEAVIKQNLAQIRNCYNRGLRLNPTLAGKVKTTFRIDAAGKVDFTRISDSTLASSEVEECIKGRITTWAFPTPRGGTTVDVSYPFLLRPQ